MSEAPSESQLDVIFYHGAYSLWQFLSQKFNIDIRDVCARVAVDEPSLLTSSGKYAMRVVPNDYQSSLSADPMHTEHITFLFNCVNVVFNMLKEGIIRHGDHILRRYSFQLDLDQNLELVLTESANDAPYAESIDDSIKLGINYQYD
jgi:hypothetical protein